ncbi:MAG: hypothetical protein NC340_07840 [Ruminococcus flavefaciens]|nr:hypothetical protein [Ruminococcus flavefaciens]MCM1228676.1 hypothetical protein [Ruminococcus flavefaciens]
MADGNKSIKLEKAVPYLVKLLIVVLVVVFGWLKLSGRCIFIFGTLISGYTFAFVSAFAVLLAYLLSYMKKNNGNFDFTSGFYIAVLSVILICMVNSFAEDRNNSKVKDVLPIAVATEEDSDVPSVMLCEVTKYNNIVNGNSTYIDVYRVNGRIAKKLGVIDEVYFSVECIKNDMYTYFINYEKNTITIECSYGTFGDGIVMMNPAYDTGKIQYIFKLD